MKEEFTPVIGLEIHVQLNTKTKLFCSCSTDYIGAVPNTNVCPLCLGLPGTLPVLNARVVEAAVRTSLALNCTINHITRFHRKNYFYPDLPKAYQISQYDLPIAEHGSIEIAGDDGSVRKIGITRLHLEEDAGKLVHSAQDGRLSGSRYSFVDYNRAGVPLAEIVSDPDLKSPAEARKYATRLRQLVRYLGVSDGDMENGSLRVDANISVKCSDGRWGNRTEIKNMNSLRALERGLEYEIKRQSRLLARQEEVVMETRHWDDSKGITASSRSKEEAHDYRYFPEPDLPPLILPDDYEDGLKSDIPELPWDKEKRFKEQYDLSDDDILTLTENAGIASFFEDCVKAGGSARRSANWVRTEVLRFLHENKISLEEFPVKVSDLAEVIGMIDSKKLSNTAAKQVFEALAATDKSLGKILEQSGIQTGGIGGEDLRAIVLKIVEDNPEIIDTIKSGKDKKDKKLKFLQGLVMRETRGQADPGEVVQLIHSMIEQ